MKTYSPTPESIDRQWFLVDAQAPCRCSWYASKKQTRPCDA